MGRCRRAEPGRWWPNGADRPPVSRTLRTVSVAVAGTTTCGTRHRTGKRYGIIKSGSLSGGGYMDGWIVRLTLDLISIIDVSTLAVAGGFILFFDILF